MSIEYERAFLLAMGVTDLFSSALYIRHKTDFPFSRHQNAPFTHLTEQMHHSLSCFGLASNFNPDNPGDYSGGTFPLNYALKSVPVYIRDDK